MKWGTEISFEEFKKEVVRPIQEHVAKVISEQLNKNELFDLHAYYGGKIIGDYDGRRIYIDVSAEV